MLANKKIVITGAASGIGMAVLKLLAAKPDNIILAVDCNIAPLKEMRQANVHPYACDISAPENVDKLFEETERLFGAADIFFANAGFAYYEKINTADWGHIESLLRVNTISPIYSYEKYCAQMGGLPGHFVIMSSAMGLMAIPGYTIYCASKYALNGFREAIEFERPDNICVTGVYPIATKTNFFKTANKRPCPEAFPVMKPETVARRIVFGIEKQKKIIKPSRLFNCASVLFALLPFTKKWYCRVENKKFQKWRSGDTESNKEF